jgi:hypothetical protein
VYVLLDYYFGSPKCRFSNTGLEVAP